MRRLYLLIVISLISCHTHTTSPPWIFSKVDSSRLLFANGRVVETSLYELTYIGQIPLEHKSPLLIFSGRDCDGCDENVSMYMQSPSDGKLEVEFGKNRYQCPGTETDFETDKLLYTSRAFYGQVLENTNGVIWYENRLMENGNWQHDVFLSWMDHDIRRDTMYYSGIDSNQTFALLKQGLCKEIKGRRYTSEP
jgi:hypothetical protein